MNRIVEPVIRPFLVLGGADLVAKALGFAVTLVVVRHFGPAGFGSLNFAATVVAYALMIGTAGTDLFAVRHVAAFPSSVGTTASTIILVRLCVSAVVYAVLLAFAVSIPVLREALDLIALLGLGLFTGAVALDWVPQALKKTHILAAENVGTQGLYLGLTLWGLKSGGRLWAVPVAQLVAEGVVAACLLGWMIKCVGAFHRPSPIRQWPGILRESAPIGGIRIIRTIVIGSDLLLLGLFVRMEEVGWYAGAHKLFLLSLSGSGLYHVVLFPHLSQRAIESNAALRSEILASLRRVLPVALPVVGLLVLFAPFILATLYGPSFRAASLALQLLLPAGLASLIAHHFQHALVAQGRQRTGLWHTFVSATVHVALKLALIPVLGIAGAALGTLLGECARIVLGWRAMQRGSMGPTGISAQHTGVSIPRSPTRE